MANEEMLTLYLAPWQKRMVKDFMSSASLRKIPFAKITKVLVRNPKGTCLASYKLPPEGMRVHDWLIYLTDEQMNVVREKLSLRTPISSINVSPESLKSGAIQFA